MKNEALEKLNRLEKMIDRKIDNGVQNILDRKVTIQDNPFFKKKQAYKGLHTFQETADATLNNQSGSNGKRNDVLGTVVTHEVRITSHLFSRPATDQTIKRQEDGF